MAQDTMEELMREVQDTPVRAELCPAELEIYKYLANTDHVSWKKGEVGAWGDDLVIVAGVINNGGRPAAFDYAIGSCKTHEVWAIVQGTTLKPGAKDVDGFRISHRDLVDRLPSDLRNTTATGKLCIGILLLKDGSRDLFRDGNIPNHDKQSDVAVDRVVG